MNMRLFVLLLAGVFAVWVIVDGLLKRRRQVKPNSAKSTDRLSSDADVVGEPRVISPEEAEQARLSQPLRAVHAKRPSVLKSLATRQPSAKVSQPNLDNADLLEPSLGSIDDALMGNEISTQQPPVTTQKPAAAIEKPAAPLRDVVVLYVLAKSDTRFDGNALLQALLAAGLKHSASGIFNYYGQPKLTDRPLFSIASAHEPGVFDIDDMANCNCHGLCIFMKICCEEPITAFSQLLEVVHQLAADLDGVICDGNRQPCTQAYLQQCRQDILDYTASQCSHLAEPIFANDN